MITIFLMAGKSRERPIGPHRGITADPDDFSKKKEGKRTGLNQYHFPGCVLEVFVHLDALGTERLHNVANCQEKILGRILYKGKPSRKGTYATSRRDVQSSASTGGTCAA
jgi:hypothetical protein